MDGQYYEISGPTVRDDILAGRYTDTDDGTEIAGVRVISQGTEHKFFQACLTRVFPKVFWIPLLTYLIMIAAALGKSCGTGGWSVRAILCHICFASKVVLFL